MMMTIARHNDVRDLIAGLMHEAGLVDIETEPRLLSCQGSDLPGGRSGNPADEATVRCACWGFLVAAARCLF